MGEEGQEKLLGAKVLVIGAGGLGSPAIMYLTAAGVGTLGIADFDRVDLSNLQRQIIHKASSVGREKAESAAETARALNPDIKIILHKKITAENISSLIKDYDFIIDATDNFESKFLINDACVMNKKPYSHGGVVGFQGQAMTYVPGEGPCLRGLLGDVPSPEEETTSRQVGILGAAAGILGSVQAMEAVKYITSAGRLLTGRLLTIDGLGGSFKVLDVTAPDPNCSVCSKKTQ
ncbi:MAG: HesA/MoeB/ThiF family protein [Clostridiales bacterium]|nr:HesA/MoeB/ThiF family protein [Clostridiales bacterium]